jgi:hypothetical protein
LQWGFRVFLWREGGVGGGWIHLGMMGIHFQGRMNRVYTFNILGIRWEGGTVFVIRSLRRLFITYQRGQLRTLFWDGSRELLTGRCHYPLLMSYQPFPIDDGAESLVMLPAAERLKPTPIPFRIHYHTWIPSSPPSFTRSFHWHP